MNIIFGIGNHTNSKRNLLLSEIITKNIDFIIKVIKKSILTEKLK